MHALLLLAASGLAAASGEYLLLARHAQVTQRAVFEPESFGNMMKKRQQSMCPSANYTPCPDGSGCCPGGAACFQSNGVGLCSVTCQAAQPQCVFNGVSACCGMGEVCGGSVCVPASTAAPTSTPSTVAPTTTTTDSSPVPPPTSSLASSPTSSSSVSVLNTSGLTTIPLPSNSVSFPTTSSSAASCPSPSVYCTWSATTLASNKTTATLTALEGCCAGGCNPTSPGICLPATVTSTSFAGFGTSATKGTATTSGVIATQATAGAASLLVERSWVLILAGLVFML